MTNIVIRKFTPTREQYDAIGEVQAETFLIKCNESKRFKSLIAKTKYNRQQQHKQAFDREILNALNKFKSLPKTNCPLVRQLHLTTPIKELAQVQL